MHRPTLFLLLLLIAGLALAHPPIRHRRGRSFATAVTAKRDTSFPGPYVTEGFTGAKLHASRASCPLAEDGYLYKSFWWGYVTVAATGTYSCHAPNERRALEVIMYRDIGNGDFMGGINGAIEASTIAVTGRQRMSALFAPLKTDFKEGDRLVLQLGMGAKPDGLELRMRGATVSTLDGSSVKEFEQVVGLVVTPDDYIRTFPNTQ